MRPFSRRSQTRSPWPWRTCKPMRRSRRGRRGWSVKTSTSRMRSTPSTISGRWSARARRFSECFARSSRWPLPTRRCSCTGRPAPGRSSSLAPSTCGARAASELFGHVMGSFTGAIEKHVGRFALADQGTIFLDEVGELPLEMQVKLLRVLQEQEFEPVGSNQTVRVNVRVIAATNRDLEEAVHAGRFRADLFYRLNVFPLRVPSLRERASDIPQLATFFFARFAKKFGRQVDPVSPETMDRLVSYPWPGNIRELQNFIERAVVLSQGPLG